MAVLGFPFLSSIRHFPHQKKKDLWTQLSHVSFMQPPDLSTNGERHNLLDQQSSCFCVSWWRRLFSVLCDCPSEATDGGWGVCFTDRPFANWSNVLPLRVFKMWGLVHKDREGQDGWETRRGLITVMNSFSVSDVGQSVFYLGSSREESPGTSVRS